MKIDTTRLNRDIETTAEFGSIETKTGRGRTVLAGTEANEKARDYFVQRLEDAGCDVRIDAVGNVTGRWTPSGSDPNADPVAAGSHLDSVVGGGIFDGPLGVYSALEAVRTMQDADITPDRPIDVVCFTEEEGVRFSETGLLGSSVAVGKRSVEDALSLQDDDGTTLETSLEEIGYRGDGVLDPSEWDSWFELHIEQGEHLVNAGVPVGVEPCISGHILFRIEVIGESNHVAATPMDKRRDALAASAEFTVELERIATTVADRTSNATTATVSTVSVEPNNPIVIPGRVELGGNVSAIDMDPIETVEARIHDELSRLERTAGVDTSFERTYESSPVPMSDRCREAVHRAGDAEGIKTMELHSGAAHDTLNVAGLTDAALLYAPSKGGITHSPDEWTSWDDCASATTVLARAMYELSVSG